LLRINHVNWSGIELKHLEMNEMKTGTIEHELIAGSMMSLPLLQRFNEQTPRLPTIQHPP
jgi:hypothetical protein